MLHRIIHIRRYKFPFREISQREKGGAGFIPVELCAFASLRETLTPPFGGAKKWVSRKDAKAQRKGLCARGKAGHAIEITRASSQSLPTRSGRGVCPKDSLGGVRRRKKSCDILECPQNHHPQKNRRFTAYIYHHRYNMKAKYVNPFTDFGFKKIFGEEASKPMLLDFLNAILPEQATIKSLSFKNSEQLGLTDLDRKAIYDIYCENEQGEKFIVELQKAKQNYFKERTIYYSTFPIREQAEKGEWNYNLKAVYCIGVLDFTFDDYDSAAEKEEVVHVIKLKNQNGKTFYNKLTYIYLEMPNFKKAETELTTRLDKWLFFIKHLEDFQSIPAIFKGEVVFEQAFEKAELAKFNQAETDNYENSLKIYRDLKGVIDTARTEGKTEGKMEGIVEGKVEGKTEAAKVLKLKGVAMDIIISATGLTEEQINNL